MLRAGYRVSAETPADRQAALRIALSRYNTGDARRGFRNGYVSRVEAAAVQLRLAAPPIVGTLARPDRADPDLSPPAPAPAWDIFGRRQAGPVVFATPAER